MKHVDAYFDPLPVADDPEDLVRVLRFCQATDFRIDFIEAHGCALVMVMVGTILLWTPEGWGRTGIVERGVDVIVTARGARPDSLIRIGLTPIVLVEEMAGGAGYRPADLSVEVPQPAIGLCPSGNERERQEQALNFAWGNLGVSTNHHPSREVFEKLARDRYGWTPADFEAWWARNTTRRADVPDGCKCGSTFTACPIPGAPHKPVEGKTRP